MFMRDVDLDGRRGQRVVGGQDLFSVVRYFQMR